MTYFELGKAYSAKNNDFNAIEAYLSSLSKNCELASVNNIGVAYQNLGLQKQALVQYNIAVKIEYMEKLEVIYLL